MLLFWVTEFAVFMCLHAVTLKFKCHLKFFFLKRDLTEKCKEKGMYQISDEHLYQNYFFPSMNNLQKYTKSNNENI